MIFVGIWFEFMKKKKVFVKPIAKKQSSVERESDTIDLMKPRRADNALS